MQCPCCHQQCSKKLWSQSQWEAASPYANGFIGCKECRRTRAANWTENLTPALQELLVGFATCLDSLCHQVLAYEKATVQWDSFMWSWESELLQATRKEMSHYGGLPVSYPWEPTHWTDNVSGDAQSASKFYDAGNDVYAFAIHALFPNAESTSRYNSTYLGDVIEGVLGVCWVTRQVTSMGVLLTLASKYIFALKTLLSLESLDKMPNRQRLTEFVQTNSQRWKPQQQHVTTSSSSTSPAAACPQQQHATR